MKNNINLRLLKIQISLLITVVSNTLLSIQVNAQCTTPPNRVNPTITLGNSLTVGNSTSFYMNSYSYFVIENVTTGRNIRISTCGCVYDSQITLRDWSTDTYLAYNDDNGPACSGTASSLDYSGNSTYPHVKVILNQYNCLTTTGNNTNVTVTFVSDNLTPSNPSSVSVSTNPICSGNSTQLTANGAVGTVYWYTGGCGSTYYTTGNPINVSPSSSTTYYARNYNNGYFSSGCASATVTVNPPAPGAPSSASGTSTSSSAANISWASSSNTTTYYWVVSTSPTATYGTGSWYGTTSGTSTSVSGLSANTAYYLRVYANNSCGSSGYTTSSAFTTYPSNPTSITGTTTICNGSSTTLTANGNQGTVYWYTGGCGSTQIGTGNTINVSPSSSTTYYARNYNGNWSAGCASATVTVNPSLSAVSLSPSTAQSICIGGSGSQLTASETGGGTITGRQWGKRSSSGGSITTISGATSSTFTPTASNLGGAGTWYVVCTSTPTCGSATVSNEVTVTVAPTSVGGSVAGSTSVCSGTNSTTLTLSGHTGSITKWQYSTVSNFSSSVTDVANTTTTLTATNLTTTRYYRAVITSGACSAANSEPATITVNALPTVASITGTTAVCTQFTTTLSCATAGGTWSSSDETKATVNSSGVVTGVAAGTAIISYTVTNGYGCSAASTATVTVSQSLASPTSVTATPTSIQSGQSSNLNATSSGNTIYWYTAATGGSAAGSSASGANFNVSPTVTTTYYAEANSTQSFYINTLTANNSSVTDHNSYTGDDRGGIAVTPSYYYYTGDNYTVRYNMPGLTNPTSCTRRDGLFSDLGTGTLYTLHNGSSDPVYGSNVSPFNVTQFRTMTADLTIGGSAAVTLSSAVSMSSGSAAIYAGSNFVILQNGTSFYRVDIPSGTVTNMGTYTINRYSSESWATWGVAELNNGVYSVLYRENGTHAIKRLNLSTGAVTTVTTFSNLSDMCSFTYSPANNRWYFHYEGSSQFGGSSETAGYADGTHTVSSTGCPSASRTAVTVTVANPPTVTTASITEINATTATGGGNVTDQGGAEVTARGVCWSTSQNPIATGSHTSDGTGTGAFTSSITGLTAGTLYYVRAYATNSIGTSYGSQVSFTSYAPGVIGSSQSICSGSSPALFTSVSAATAMPGVTYQWQVSTDNSTFTNISGATATTYQAGALSAQTYYRRNAISGSVTLSSNVITISIDAGISAPSPATASPSTILAGQTSNLNATSTGNNIKWYTDATAGTLLTTVSSGTNYAVSPSVSTTYYAQAVPISCTDNTLENILTNLNSNYTNITSQIPNPYNFALDGSGGVNANYISDGGSDMYDGGNYVSTNNNSSFSYNDNSVLTSSIFGTGGKYFTRKVNNLFVLAADMNNVSTFSVNGDYGTDGGGSKSSSTFSITVDCRTYNCFLSRVYGTGDPSINELFIIPANSSASHTGIANTSNSYHYLNNISASTRMYYLLYAGTSGGLISDASAQSIATAFITQTQAVVSGAAGCPSSTRTPVTVTVSGIPTVTTTAISSITATTASGGGNVTADGGSSVTARGVCWSTSQNPTVSLSTKTTDGSGTGTFTSSITSLTAGTTYYVRAYATNSMGTGYGDQVSFAPFQLGSFPDIAKTYGDPPFTLVNPTSGSPGAFSYTSGNTDVATVSGNTVTIQQAGTSTITATQAASGGYGSATTNCLLTVAKANQVLTLNIPTSEPLNTFTGGSTLNISATSSSGLTVTISINASSTASGTLTATATPGVYTLSGVGSTGTIIFDATQAGNTNYNSASISQSMVVTMGNQVITFNALPSKTFGDPAFSVSATGGASGNPVTFTSSNTDIATCSGTNGATVTIIGAGSCLITANQAGNASWNAAPAVSQTLSVGKATPVITNFNDVTKSFDADPFTLNATSASTGAFSYTSSNSDVATISGNTVTVQGVGESTLTANQAADNNYFAASETATLTVGQATQTISITSIPDIYLLDFEPTTLTVTASSSSGLPVTLTLQSGSVATIDGTTLTSTGATGTVTVIANQAGNSSFAAATQVTEVFAVTKANQTITFDALATKHVGDPDFDLTATTTSELLITYTSSNTNVATIDEKTVHLVGAGTSNITASQAGNEYYNAATPVVRAQQVDAEQFKNWTGSVSTDWNVAGNWDPSGVPTITDNLIIGSTANQPHVTLSVSSPALSNKLEIESGATLTIDEGKALTVSGVFTNAGTLQILSSASGTGSLITASTISNTGTINIQRYITNDRWHLISIPVTNATASTYLNDYLQQWAEDEAKWIDIEEPSTALNVTEGYGLWTSQNSAHTYTYTGTPNTGSKSKALTYNEVPFMDNDGANLLGNPYPSAIDWSGLDDDYGAIYYWVGNGVDGDGEYVTWINGVGSGSRYVPPMQGFFVVVPSAGTFMLSNSDRVHSNPGFYKSDNEVKDNLLVLETVSKGISDKLYVQFDPEAAEEFELQNDAYKFLSGTPGLSELYSYSYDKKLSIDARPRCEVVQLGFANSLSGEYTIKTSQVSGITEAVLEDTKLATFTDLLTKSYTFSYEAGESDKRFKLHFGPLGTDDISKTPASIYSYGKTAYINLNENEECDIYIYTMSGQLIASRQSASGLVSEYIATVGVYTVKVVNKTEIITKRIFINQ